MKLEYQKIIHKEEGKPDRISFTIVNKNKDGLIQRCCKESDILPLEVAYDQRQFRFVPHKERDTSLDEPKICIIEWEMGFCSDDHEQYLIPINHCPMCGVKIEIVRTGTIERKHTYKTVKKEYDEKEHFSEDKIIEA